MQTYQTESIIPSWSKYHSNKECNVPSVKGNHSLLPLIDAPVYTIASQYHCMNIIMKTIEYLNPGPIAVDACDQPVYALTKEVQYRNPEKFGLSKYFCLMGGLHIEMCILVIHGELIDGSGLCEILSKSNMYIFETQNLLTASHVKTTGYCIEAAASVIYLKLIEAHRMSSSDLEPNEWLEEVSKTSPMCSYWNMILGFQHKILLYVRPLCESNFRLSVSALARFMN